MIHPKDAPSLYKKCCLKGRYDKWGHCKTCGTPNMLKHRFDCPCRKEDRVDWGCVRALLGMEQKEIEGKR